MIKLLLTCAFFTVSFSYAQYCVSGGPSSANDSNIESVTLTGDGGGISYTGCPGVLGLEEFFSQSVILGAGSNYLLYVQFGTCGGNYGGAGEVWIDFNQNGIFESSESIGVWAGTPPTAQSVFSFTVPATAMMGQTRMRINHQEGGTIPLDPCANFTWGSSTDFLIDIQGGIDCTGYTGDDESDPRAVNSYPYSESYSNAVCYSNNNPVYNSPDVYYLLTNFASLSSLEISLCGSSFDTFLTVKDTQGNAVAINDDAPNCGPQSQLTIPTAGHDSLYVIVEGWNNEMGDYTIAINQGALSVENLEEQSFSLFPNPATSSVTYEGALGGQLYLLNASGAIVKNRKVSSHEEIDISDLPKGVYLFKIQNESSTTVQKLLIQ